MSICDVKKAEAARTLLPPYIRSKLPTEEKIWKKEIFENLEKYIKEDKPDQIAYWFDSIDMYTSFETFTFTKEELEKLANILYEFIISSKHLPLVVTAASIFASIVEPKHMDLNLKFKWRPVYKVLYDSVLSHSKTKYTKYPSKFVDSIIVFIRYARNYWEETATEEMLKEWTMFLDPHYQTFTLGLCQLTLFLPANQGQHKLWIDTFRNLWTLYRTVAYDFLFFEVFARLVRHGYTDIPWHDLLPFMFNVAAVHMGIPTSLLETQIPTAVGFHPELYSQFFKDVATLDEILTLFSIIISYLLSGPTRDLTRSLLQRMLHLIAPLCTNNQNDEDSDCDAPIVFIDHLIVAYCKRLKHERDDTIPSKCEPLTSEDNQWLCEQLLPLVFTTQFHETPPLNNINKFVQLCPQETIPTILRTIAYSFDYEHLKSSALQAMVSISPTVFKTGESLSDFMTIVQKVPNEISFMDTPKSSAAFSLLAIVATSIPLGIEYEPFVIQIATKCIEFAEHAVGDDFIPSLGELLSTLGRLMYAIPEHTGKRIASMVLAREDELPEQALAVLVEALDIYGPPVFKEKALKAKTHKDFLILKALARQSNQFFLPYIEELKETILGGFFNSEKKIYEEAVSTTKWFLKNMLNSYPLLPNKQGFTTAKNAAPAWHVPSEEEIVKALGLAKTCLSAAKEFISEPNKSKQLLGILICRGVIKGIVSGVSSEDLEHEDEPEGLKRPQLTRFHDPRIAEVFEQAVECIIDCLKNEKSHPEAITKAIAYLEIVNEPRDHIATELDGLTTEYNYNAGNGRVIILENPLNACTYNTCYWKALSLYSMRHSLDHVYFPKITRKVLEIVFKFATSPNEKIRNAVASYVASATGNFKNHFIDLYDEAITLLEKVGNPDITPEDQEEVNKLGKQDDLLAGLSGVISAMPNCTFNPQSFTLLMRAAVAICVQLSPDEHLDAARSLRQIVVICLDQTDTSNSEFITDPPFSEMRKWVAREAMKRHAMYPSNRETQNYAAALVCSVLFGQPLIFDANIIQFIINLMKTDDKVVRDCVIQIMPSILEAMIPRVPRPQGIVVSEVTPENYDQAFYEDRRMPTQAQKMPHFLTREEYLDEKVVSKYFPNDDPKERVKMHKLLFEQLVDGYEPVNQLITLLVDAQVHKEENFSKSRVLFWCTLCRLLGLEFTRKLFDKADKMITQTSSVQQHVVAAEIFAGVLHSLKCRPYSYVKQISEFVCPFVTRLIATTEPEFHNLWYFSFFACFNEMDPRRLFWLYNHILTCVPTDDNIRAARAVSLITDILLDVAYRIGGLGEKIQEIAAVPLFSNSSLEFEQIRECSVRALISMISLTFDVNLRGHNPKSIELLNKFASNGINEQFVIRFLVGAFGTQSLATLSAGEFVRNNLQHWSATIVDKDEDEEQIARAAMIAIASSNWIGSIAKLPLTKESSREIVESILNELKQLKGAWQIQVILILLIESFLASVYFFVDDDIMTNVIEEIVIPSLSHQHTDVQDSAGQLLTFILHGSMSINEKIPDYVERFSKMLKDQQISTRLAGAKGLYSIINATTLFDDVPQYVIDSFQYLTEAVETDKAVEPTITQFFADFWSSNEGNMLKSTAEILAPFKASLRPSYFC